MTVPSPPSLPPAPPVRTMAVNELRAMIEQRHVYRAKAVFELSARAATDEAAAEALSAASRLPVLRNDRMHGFVSLAWAAIVGLLAAETPQARQLAYQAFVELPAADRTAFLAYLKADRIEDAHPQL